MEFLVTFLDNQTQQVPLQVEKKLSEGNLSVYQAFSSSRKTRYAIKVFPKTSFGNAQFEKEKLIFKLHHKNVVQYIPIMPHDGEMNVLLTEFGKYGNLFKIVSRGILNTEALIRTYFHQLVEGVEYIHSKGIAHLDLKLENLVMDSEFNLKIIDFDRAQKTSDEHMTSRGTKGYRALEVIEKTCRNLPAVDIYSLGVILFIFIFQEFPFSEIDDRECQDIHSYSTFVMNNKRFWAERIQLKGNKSLTISEDLIELMNGMLHLETPQRWTIQEIKKSSWYKKPVLDSERLKNEMRARCEIIKSKKRSI